ncbi:mCG141819, partial [Mus musculus]
FQPHGTVSHRPHVLGRPHTSVSNSDALVTMRSYCPRRMLDALPVQSQGYKGLCQNNGESARMSASQTPHFLVLQPE